MYSTDLHALGAQSTSKPIQDGNAGDMPPNQVYGKWANGSVIADYPSFPPFWEPHNPSGGLATLSSFQTIHPDARTSIFHKT